jgi:hypothetical protein
LEFGLYLLCGNETRKPTDNNAISTTNSAWFEGIEVFAVRDTTHFRMRRFGLGVEESGLCGSMLDKIEI